MNNLSIILKSLNQRPIAYYPVYREMTGNTPAAVMLSQLMYWFSKKDAFYKTDSDIAAETKLTATEIKTSKQRIKALGFIDIKLRGVPATTNYIIDWDMYYQALNEVAGSDNDDEPIPSHSHVSNRTSLAKSDQLDGLNPTNKIGGIRPTNTKNTSKTLSKTTTKNGGDGKKSFKNKTTDPYTNAALFFSSLGGAGLVNIIKNNGIDIVAKYNEYTEDEHREGWAMCKSYNYPDLRNFATDTAALRFKDWLAGNLPLPRDKTPQPPAAKKDVYNGPEYEHGECIKVLGSDVSYTVDSQDGKWIFVLDERGYSIALDANTVTTCDKTH